MANLLRSPEMVEKYRSYRVSEDFPEGCVLCTKDSLVSFTYWKIITNDFPYDRIAKAHDMIVPLRHAVETELTIEEESELIEIKKGYVNKEYDFILEATEKTKSIPAHFHLHLVVVKEHYE